MFKPVFLGFGIFLITIGIASHAVESYETRVEAHEKAAEGWNVPFISGKHIEPPPWRPWALMGAGAVICCWTATVPGKIAGNTGHK